MAQNECYILRLSTELVLQILEYSPLSTCFDIALTCTTLHHQCRKLLDLHREADAKYRVTSDLCPETMIDLLKDNTRAKIERWHVRELEIWGSRNDWEDWRPWVPQFPGTCSLAGGSPTRHGLDLQDIHKYIRTALELWTFWRFDSEAIQLELEAGKDGFLKLLLIATCPRLHSLRFVKRGYDPHTTLEWMREVIKHSRRAWNGPHEMHGFESLRGIAVGIETDQRLWNNTSPLRDARDFAALFYMPNLESLYFNDLHCDLVADANDVYYDVVAPYEFPCGTSSVKHLFIDGASGSFANYYRAIADASKKLESVVLRVASEHQQHIYDVDMFVGSLSLSNGKTLRKLILYNPRGMLGDQYGNYLLDDLDEFRNLKLFTLSVYDLALEELYLMHTSPNVEQLAEYVSGSFPASTEALYIWGRSDEYVDVPASDDMPSNILDSTLASLIESGVLENLKVVYLADFEMLQIAFEEHIDGDIKDTDPGQPILQKSVAAGLKAGVHVCTLMNRDDGGYWKSFPAKPDGFELKTGPCYGERPASWRLNLQSGEWGPDCEGCGECMDCLAVYPAELWKSGRS
ncbi:hypothetical protein BFJ72_g1546 [Fusarium proliferatum]|uniref:F-box domain-containing protein n=1 Tax=Gibberella intermedia TaxID=948311 RepID=A0A420U4F6_GIBIN|nr:hypothetical protein BFJ72_g1546 [Fusarium proliferatum]